jgi:hypothetical protein
LNELQQRLDDLTARLTTLQQQVNNGLTVLNDKHETVKPMPPPPPRPREPVQPG